MYRVITILLFSLKSYSQVENSIMKLQLERERYYKLDTIQVSDSIKLVFYTDKIFVLYSKQYIVNNLKYKK